MIKRQFFFIRKDLSTPFYHETVDYFERMKEHLYKIDPEITSSNGKVNDYIHYHVIYHPTPDQFAKITDALYFGEIYGTDLKNEFKGCMKHTKINKIAFALSATNITDDVLDGDTHRISYYYTKRSDQRFVDATEHHKPTIPLLDAIASMEELVFNINFFDYDHNSKHSETRLVRTPTVWNNLRKKQSVACPDFYTAKDKYNHENGIQSGKVSEINTSPKWIYNPTEIREKIDSDLHNINLDLRV